MLISPVFLFTFIEKAHMIHKKLIFHEISQRKERKMSNILNISSILNLDKTIAASLFTGVEMPWEVLLDIRPFILALGESLSAETFWHPHEDVWIAKSAVVSASAHIHGPCIVDEEAEVRHGAFIRGAVIIGKRAVVGNSTELKNAVLFDRVQVPHFNYVGDSVMGYRAHFGAGVVTSNVKLDKTNVLANGPWGRYETGLRKFGAIVGDGAEVGCHSVLNPGTVIGRGAIIYPCSSVRGYVPERAIYKNGENIVLKQDAE